MASPLSAMQDVYDTTNGNDSNDAASAKGLSGMLMQRAREVAPARMDVSSKRDALMGAFDKLIQAQQYRAPTARNPGLETFGLNMMSGNGAESFGNAFARSRLAQIETNKGLRKEHQDADVASALTGLKKSDTGLGFLNDDQKTELALMNQAGEIETRELAAMAARLGRTPASVAETLWLMGQPKEIQDLHMRQKRASTNFDLGDRRVVIDPLTGKVSTEFEKNLAPADKPETKAAQKTAEEKAKNAVEAQAELPKVIEQGDEAIKLIDEILAHPGMSDSVGLRSPAAYAWAGDPIPGTDSADFKTRVDQLLGKQFLQAFQTLKGGGQITEVEGKKATDAIARMGTAQSEKSFRTAAEEFKGVIKQGMERAKAKASVSGTPAPLPPAPTAGKKPPMPDALIKAMQNKGVR